MLIYFQNQDNFTFEQPPSMDTVLHLFHSYCQHLSLRLCFVVTVLEEGLFFTRSGTASSAGTLPSSYRLAVHP